MDAEERRLIEQLTVAVEHRATIGMAPGLLMERLGLTADEAFKYLVSVSSLQNRKLYDIACEFVDTRELSDVPPTKRRRQPSEDLRSGQEG
jgi:AmiR/NasT family two-component response regulator